ncbi:phosphotransferase family protein [Streptomyces sp. NPDC057307]|uniref:phosphotransferase family protein n=1 Tax=Streptomyces sp. NPDC057307 TaxID=3346096 RepID=UPI00363C8838
MASGVANRAWSLGRDLVLRVPRTEAFVADLVKEAAVIPVARGAGVRTPALVTFDDSRDDADVPYMVLERAPGADLADVLEAGGAAGGVFREVGRELARLHRVTPGGEPAGVPVEYDPDVGAPRRLVEGLLADGMLDADAARWLGGWFDRLAARIPGAASRVLVHGDIAPQNLLVRPGPDSPALTGIVDWGDAMWADPAVEFAKTPLWGVPAMLDGYREGGAAAADGGSGGSYGAGGSYNTYNVYDASYDSYSPYAWEARVLRYHLTWALARLTNPAPVTGERHWTAPPAARLLGILRFFASSPPEPWSALA